MLVLMAVTVVVVCGDATGVVLRFSVPLLVLPSVEGEVAGECVSDFLFPGAPTTKISPTATPPLMVVVVGDLRGVKAVEATVCPATAVRLLAGVPGVSLLECFLSRLPSPWGE
uniref:Putative secreted protein n=1 Tax=Anopheles darlingi TaxID=43151 RepID=A0A2M4DNG5_ANODA